MATFLINTKAELLKCRKTAAYWLTLAAGLFIPVLFLVMYIAQPAEFLQKLANDPWNGHIGHAWQSGAIFLVPMYVILVTSLLVQIEYRNNTWKQVYASPRSYADVFFSKFLIILLLILTCFVLFNLSLLAGGYIVDWFQPGYHFRSHAIPWKLIGVYTGKMYLSVLAITAIQYWLSLRFRNYIAPVGIGLALLVTGLIIIQWQKISYYPYAYGALTFFKMRKKWDVISNHEWNSVVWFIAIILLAFVDMVKRKERG